MDQFNDTPGDVPNAMIRDIVTTLHTGQISGFVWLILAVGIFGGLSWLWRAFRERGIFSEGKRSSHYDRLIVADRRTAEEGLTEDFDQSEEGRIERGMPPGVRPDTPAPPVDVRISTPTAAEQGEIEGGDPETSGLPLTIIVCGGRTFDERDTVFKSLDYIANGPDGPIALVIHGGDVGAAGLAAEWATSRSIPRRSFPAARVRNHLGRELDSRRNIEMLKFLVAQPRPHLVVAFPGGESTDNMLEFASACGIKRDVVPSRDEPPRL